MISTVLFPADSADLRRIIPVIYSPADLADLRENKLITSKISDYLRDLRAVILQAIALTLYFVTNDPPKPELSLL